MVCTNCGSTIEDTVCVVCGVPARDVDALDAVTPVLAGWGSRVGATVIDTIVLIAPTLVLVLLLGNRLGDVAALATQGAYMVVLLTSPDGQTVGNRAMRTRVRDELTGYTITRRQALVRWAVIAIYGVLGTVPSAGPLFAASVSVVALTDCLYPFFNARNQTIHDRLARTIVVRT